MGQVLLGSATTTEAVCRAIQHSQASLRALSKRYGINPKTVSKWKNLSSGPTPDAPSAYAIFSDISASLSAALPPLAWHGASPCR